MASATPPALDRNACLGVLAEGGIILLPVDTLFGLACRADLEPAVERLYHLKQRPSSKSFALVFSSLPAVIDHLGVTAGMAGRLARLLPGPITVVVPAAGSFTRQFPRWAGTVGVRVPGPSPSSSLLENLPWPLALTSANLSGDAPIESCNDLPDELAAGISGHLPGQPVLGQPSTVITMDETSWSLLREGVFPCDELIRLLGNPAECPS